MTNCVNAMDLLKAEIERKRKAKQEEFGGNKYVKRSHITAVREAKLREEEEAEWRAKKHGGKGPGGSGSAKDGGEGAKMAEEEARLKQLRADADDNNANVKVRERRRSDDGASRRGAFSPFSLLDRSRSLQQTHPPTVAANHSLVPSTSRRVTIFFPTLKNDV